MEPEEKKNGTDPGEEDKTIVAYVEWKNPPKDPEDLQKALEWIQNEIVKAFLAQVEKEYKEWGIYPTMTNTEEEKEILFGKKEDEKPQGIIFGVSPIQESLEFIRKNNLIGSCICCKHWKINDKESRLVGTCQQTLKDISYDQVCDNWSKIDGGKK